GGSAPHTQDQRPRRTPPATNSHGSPRGRRAVGRESRRQCGSNPDGARQLTLAVTENAEESVYSVAPPDLLALVVGTAAVGDADLIDPQAPCGHLRRDLGFEPEPILGDWDRLDHLGPKGLVAGLHV